MLNRIVRANNEQDHSVSRTKPSVPKLAVTILTTLPASVLCTSSRSSSAFLPCPSSPSPTTTSPYSRRKTASSAWTASKSLCERRRCASAWMKSSCAEGSTSAVRSSTSIAGGVRDFRCAKRSSSAIQTPLGIRSGTNEKKREGLTVPFSILGLQ